MVRLGFALLAAPALTARVQVHESAKARIFAHLSEEDSLAAVEGLEILEQLKADSSNVDLQEKYREVIGEIAWEEDRNYLLSGMNTNQEPVMLSHASSPGERLNLMELLSSRVGMLRWFTARLGRLFTSRRDFAIEEEDGDVKYMIDGFTRSLHSRMQVSYPNDPDPKYVVRRAFNYLNPVAVAIGQYVYRVIRCEPNSSGGWAGGCEEGEMLYTITKDRLGRGTLWGQDEYRVYVGTGGCGRFTSGVLSCSPEAQIMYSLSAGLSDNSHATRFYAGNIDAIDGDFQTGRLHNGDHIGLTDIEAMQVAVVDKSEGSPRALNWPIWLTAVIREHDIHVTVEALDNLIESLDASQLEFLAAPFSGGWSSFEASLTAEQIPLFQAVFIGTEIVQGLTSALWAMAWAYHLAKSLIWADSYHVNFSGAATDELLVTLVAAIQDLTREQIAVRPANHFGVIIPGTAAVGR